MKIIQRLSVTGLALLVVVCGFAQAKPATPSIAVRGDVDRPSSYTKATLEKLAPVQTIKTTLKGKPITVRGIPLMALLEAARPRFPAKEKHPETRFVVVARGKDGYKAAFAWPELMKEVGNRRVFVAWEADGKPLDAKYGPFRLVVPEDKKPQRWTFGLASLIVIDTGKLAATR